MSEAKPTPGPFITVLPNRIGPRPHAWGVDFGDGTVVCTEHESRARLIAAAPELLEAANRVLHEVFLNSGAPDIEARTTEALGFLAEAAAKAEGRE